MRRTVAFATRLVCSRLFQPASTAIFFAYSLRLPRLSTIRFRQLSSAQSRFSSNNGTNKPPHGQQLRPEIRPTPTVNNRLHIEFKKYNDLSSPTTNDMIQFASLCMEYQQPERAVEFLFQEMEKHGLADNSELYSHLALACKRAKDANSALKLVNHALTRPNIVSPTALNLLAETISRNKPELLDSQVFFKLASQAGFTPQLELYNVLLDRCVRNADWNAAHNLHLDRLSQLPMVDTANLKGEARYLVSLLTAYTNANKLAEATAAFKYFMPTLEKVHSVWDAMIKCFAKHKRHVQVIRCFRQMEEFIEIPSPQSVYVALEACARVSAADDAVRIFSNCQTKYKLALHNSHRYFVSKALFSAGRLEEALQIYETITEPRPETLAAMIAYCKNKHLLGPGMAVHRLIDKMKVPYNDYILNALIALYGTNGKLHVATELFEKKGSLDMPDQCKAMLAMYGYNKRYHDMLELVNKILKEREPTDFEIGAALVAYNALQQPQMTVELYSSMKEKWGISPTPYHYRCLLQAFADMGQLQQLEDALLRMDNVPTELLVSLLEKLNTLEQAQRIHHVIETRKIPPSDALTQGLFKLYQRVGSMDKVLEVYEAFPEYRSFGMYKALILMFKEKNEPRKVLDVFEEMEEKRLKPDPEIAQAVVDAYKAQGEEKLAEAAVTLMKEVYKIKLKPDVEMSDERTIVEY